MNPSRYFVTKCFPFHAPHVYRAYLITLVELSADTCDDSLTEEEKDAAAEKLYEFLA